MKQAINTNMGSVSTATMRPEDLIPEFISEVRRQRRPVKGHRAAALDIERRSRKAGYFRTEDADHDLDQLFDMLDAYAPPYFYFGSHPGDGADYGYWLSDSFEDDFDGLKVSDLSEVPADYAGEVLVVNDHGNMTLYLQRTRKRGAAVLAEIWGIV